MSAFEVAYGGHDPREIIPSCEQCNALLLNLVAYIFGSTQVTDGVDTLDLEDWLVGGADDENREVTLRIVEVGGDDFFYRQIEDGTPTTDCDNIQFFGDWPCGVSASTVEIQVQRMDGSDTLVSETTFGIFKSPVPPLLVNAIWNDIVTLCRQPIVVTKISDIRYNVGIADNLILLGYIDLSGLCFPTTVVTQSVEQKFVSYAGANNECAQYSLTVLFEAANCVPQSVSTTYMRLQKADFVAPQNKQGIVTEMVDAALEEQIAETLLLIQESAVPAAACSNYVGPVEPIVDYSYTTLCAERPARGQVTYQVTYNIRFCDTMTPTTAIQELEFVTPRTPVWEKYFPLLVDPCASDEED